MGGRMCRRGRRGLFLRAFAPSFHVLTGGYGSGVAGSGRMAWWTARETDGLERNYAGRKWRFWKLDDRLGGRLGGQLDGQLGGHFSAYSRTQKGAFMTKRGCSLAVLRQKGVAVFGAASMVLIIDN